MPNKRHQTSQHEEAKAWCSTIKRSAAPQYLKACCIPVSSIPSL